MARVLITSGPTRQFIDPVRYLTNASSGKMGAALAAAALAQGHQAWIVSGPVEVEYPSEALVHWVVTTDEMLARCRAIFPECDGLIGAAAPCDYQPVQVQPQKITKTGQPLTLELYETPDVVATLGSDKAAHQWVVGFALETEDARFRALAKMERKSCDLIVSNGPEAMNAEHNQVEVLDRNGQTVGVFNGTKPEVARQILSVIQERLVARVG